MPAAAHMRMPTAAATLCRQRHRRSIKLSQPHQRRPASPAMQTQQRAPARPRNPQAALSIVLFACAAAAAHYYGALAGAGLGIFTALVGGATAGLYLAAPRIPNPALNR